MIAVTPQLVGNAGLRALRAAIAVPDRYAIEPKVDGVRGLVTLVPDVTRETRYRRGERREWLRFGPRLDAIPRLGQRLPILHDGTALDGELIAGRFRGTMAALYGSKRHQDALGFVVFDVPILAGVDQGVKTVDATAPGATSRPPDRSPSGANVAPDGLFRPANELRQRFAELASSAGPVITSCGSGTTASHNGLARIAGGPVHVRPPLGADHAAHLGPVADLGR